jgi:DNA topoisomerase III
VEFDEPWAKEGAKPPETAEEPVQAGADEGAAAA